MSLDNRQYVQTPEGLYIPSQNVIVGGVFDIYVNDELVESQHNLVTTEGLNYILDVALSGGAQLTTWYATAFKNNVAPGAGWTAANFHATAADLEGGVDVVEANRPQWVEAGVAAGVIDNYASKAEITVASATLDLYGVALLSSNVFQGGTGKLLAATAFGAVRSLVQDDVLGIGYRFTIASA